MAGFTTTYLTNLRFDKTKKTAYYISESANRPGFVIRITPKNKISFVYRYIVNGEKRKYFGLGTYPYISLKEAGEKYQEARKLVENKVDPIEYYKDEKQKKKQQGSVKDLFELYCDKLEKEGKFSAKETRRCLYKDALGSLGEDKRANEISTGDINNVLKQVYARGAYTLSNRLRSYLHAAFEFGWYYDESGISGRRKIKFNIGSNPVSRTKKLAKEKTGKRALSKLELKQFWDAISLPSAPISKQMEYFLKLLILTSGQRVREILEANLDEFSLDSKNWTIPEERTKNGREHNVVLSKPAIKIIKNIIEYNKQTLKSKSKLLFPRTIKSKAQKNTDVPIHFGSVTKAVARVCKDANIIHFSPRDLRRTAKTLMGEAGISLEVRNRVQNHARQGLAKNYDYYDYKKQLKKAMKKWTKLLVQSIGA
jgi:integrase